MKPILLIDEIDKADIEFPNDLLQELDRMDSMSTKRRSRVGEAAARRDHRFEQ